MTAPESWITTEATVTTCRYQFTGLSNLAFGFSTQKNFRITFDYYAHARLYSGTFQSDIAIPQNQRIPIAYNPLDPRQNTRDAAPAAAPSRPPLLAIALTGSVVLSLLWLAVLHGCH